MSQYLDNKDLFLEPKVTQYGNHMVMTNVVKPIKRKFYNIDTRFRDDYDEYSKTSPTFYNITLPQRINDVKSIMVCNAEIPLTYYNISAALENNAFQIVSSNNSYTVIIPDGNYDTTTLVTIMNNQINNIGLQLTDLSFSIIDNNSVFTSNSGKTYTIHFAINTSMVTSGTSQNTDFDKYINKLKINA
jgi:hypothetical protein